MVKIETKAKLAKLLAMENIDIQHKQVKTAMFDVKNRCLILPTWKDMPNHLYDLLVGHEVGHALYTPNNEEQLKELIKKSSKHCVNVVEDARIETLMKKRYPGLVKSFYNGYQHLIEKDFFGLSEMNFDTINLLDKLNLYFKVPNAVIGVVEFNEIEQSFVDRIEKIKKFSELEDICVDICDYIKENREDEDKDEYANMDFDEESDEYANEDDFETDETESGDDGESEDESQGSSDKENENEDSDDLDGESYDQSDKEGKDEKEALGNSNPDYNNTEEPSDLRSETMDNFEKSLNNLNDVNTENLYATLPKEILDVNISNYKKVWENFNDFYDLNSYREVLAKGSVAVRERYDWGFDSESSFTDQTKSIFESAKKELDSIKKESTKNVAHMAMEFERKKSADVYKRTLIAKTGILDTNKLFSAKYNEDVFKKSVRVPDGKNHGLCIFVDWSGSMAPNMAGCIKQLIELMLFCKKVNIPFEVYSFTDVGCYHKKNSFGYRHGDLVVDKSVSLNNYFSSQMSTKEFNEALLNMVVISNSFRGGYQCYPIPDADRLGYTPLNGAIIASEKIINDFRKRNAIQKVHAIWITDGEGNNVAEQYQIDPETKLPKYAPLQRYAKTLVIQDEVMKKNYKVKGRYLTPILFEIVKDRLGCNVVGFFLDSQFGSKSSMLKHWYEMPINHVEKRTHYGVPVQANVWMQKARKDGYLVKTVGGYDEYYIISNKPIILKVNEIDEKMTARKMATIFSAKSTKFKKSRVILSRFIDLITV